MPHPIRLSLLAALCLAAAPKAHAQGPEAKDYAAFFAECPAAECGTRLIVLRSFRQGGEKRLLTVDPQTLATDVRPEKGLRLLPRSWPELRELLQGDPYGRALKDSEEAVRRRHLNPAHHYPEIFIRAAGRLEDSRLVWLASGAFAYAAFRLVEAFGLWHERPWAEWLAIVSAGLYLPVEVFELWKHASILGALLLIGNAALVLGLLHIRLKALETR